MQLAPATVRSGKTHVTLSTTLKTRKGTRTNPEWTSRYEDCATLGRRLQRSIESCDRNGPRNVNCKISEKKDLDSSSQLDIPAKAAIEMLLGRSLSSRRSRVRTAR